ncbi:MAG: signal peptidase II [Clostridia bacterium]|nr:signal peptidase II [Clostridia bacterium]MBQ4194162.1 signal peptidase II [Clostridia bacterium]
MIITILVIVLSVVADQVSKHFLAAFLTGLENRSYRLIPDVLHLTYLENRGAAFGMLSEHRWVFMVFSVIGIAAILLLVAKEKPASRWVQVAAGLIAGGGIANMIDRVRLGYVVDFIDCRFVDFYVFNIADSCVTVGCAIYFVAVIVEEIRAYRKKKADGTPEETADTPGAPEAEGSAPEAEEKERRGDA